MKPQIIDRYVYVKGKKISEVDNKTVLDGTEYIPLAQNDMNYSTTVDTISDYVDSVHDYLTTEDYNDLKSQIDSERTNRQEADNDLNQSIQDTKSELHSTISGVESELLNDVSNLQEQIDNINDTGIANGVTLDTVQTITGEKTFTTVPKSTADATEDTDLVNKKYVDDAVANVDVDLSGYATETWVNEQGFARTSDIPEGLEIGETAGTAFDGGRGKAVENIVNNIKNRQIPIRIRRNDIFGRDVNNLRVEFVVPSTGEESSYDVQFKAATTELAGLMSTKDKAKLDGLSNTIIINGDGTKYLSDNGTYNTIEIPDLSNYVDNNTFNESITQLDDKYLPLTGGTLSGNLTLPDSGVLTVGKESYPNKASIVVYSQDSISIGAKTTINGSGITIEKTSGNNPSIVVNQKPVVLTTNASGITISPITQTAYDELQDKNANTLYIITE